MATRISSHLFPVSRPLLALTLSCFAIAACLHVGAAIADVYKVVDEEGRVTFTDTPPQGKKAEKIQLREGNSIPRTTVTTQAPSEERKQGVPSDYQVRIVSPPDEFHVNPGMRNLNIQVAVEPALHPSHELQITDNGEVIEGTSLENIVVRGRHVIQAHVVDQEGNPISQSEPIEVYVHRPALGN